MALTGAGSKRRLADALLDGGLTAYVERHRESGASWRLISLSIREDVDLDIHPETLRLWFSTPANADAA